MGGLENSGQFTRKVGVGMSFLKQWAKYFFGCVGGVAAVAAVLGLPVWYMSYHPATPLEVIGVINTYLLLILTGIYAYLEYKGY